MLTHALYDESVSRSIVYLASVLWLDTESLGFNAEVRGLGQFEIRLLRRPKITTISEPFQVTINNLFAFNWPTDNIEVISHVLVSNRVAQTHFRT